MKAGLPHNKAMAKRFVIYGALLLAVVLAWKQSHRHASVATASATPAPRAAVPGDSVWQELDRPLLLPADDNPFSVQVAAPPAPVVVPVTEPTPVLAPQPVAPDLAVEVVGRMIAVDGREVVYALHEGRALELAVGQVLPNGYVVKRMTPDAIEFEYPSMNALRRIKLSPTPKFEIR